MQPQSTFFIKLDFGEGVSSKKRRAVEVKGLHAHPTKKALKPRKRHLQQMQKCGASLKWDLGASPNWEAEETMGMRF